jgi:hypothetical protein
MRDEKSPKRATAKEGAAPIETVFALHPQAFQTSAHNMAKISQGMAEFMQTRLMENASMWEKLAACRDPSEVMQCHAEFASKRGTDHAGAARKLSRLTCDFAGNYSVDPAPKPTATD